jgi:hypothetical protein
MEWEHPQPTTLPLALTSHESVTADGIDYCNR